MGWVDVRCSEGKGEGSVGRADGSGAQESSVALTCHLMFLLQGLSLAIK